MESAKELSLLRTEPGNLGLRSSDYKYLTGKDRESKLFTATEISDLPQQLVEKILSYLQVWDLGICVSVCKQWKSLVDSQGFPASSAQAQGRRPFLLFHGSYWESLEETILGGWIVFDINNSRWLTLRNDFLLSYLNIDSSNDVSPSFYTFTAVSEGGLMCVFFRNCCKESGMWNLLGLVCNPITKAVSKLPWLELEFLDINIVIILHMDDYGGKTYKVFLLSKARLYLYDSEAKTQSWQTLHKPSPQRETPVSAVMLRSYLYILWKSDLGELSVATYNINKHVWSEKVYVPLLPIDTMEKWSCPPQLVIINHNIFLTRICLRFFCRGNCCIIWKVMEATDEKGIVFDELPRTCAKEMIGVSVAVADETPTPSASVAENCIVVTELMEQAGLLVMMYDLHGELWRRITHSCEASCECCQFCSDLVTPLCLPQGRWMSLNMSAKIQTGPLKKND